MHYTHCNLTILRLSEDSKFLGVDRGMVEPLLKIFYSNLTMIDKYRKHDFLLKCRRVFDRMSNNNIPRLVDHSNLQKMRIFCFCRQHFYRCFCHQCVRHQCFCTDVFSTWGIHSLAKKCIDFTIKKV